MINVLIFGLFGNRARVERVLSNNINICGYTDVGAAFDDLHFFENKPFYAIDDLARASYDYILVCCEERRVYLQCESMLVDRGISMSKIIPTWSLMFQWFTGLCESVFQSTYTEFLKLDRTYKTIIFGTSISRMGIISDMLSDSCYKFSLNGMDLHAFELYIKALIKNSKHFKKVNEIILEVPYFMLNIDNCGTPNAFRRLCMYDQFEDYGTFAKQEDVDIRIKQFHILEQLVGEKYEKTISSYSNNYMSLSRIQEEEEFFNMWPWVKLRGDTINENEERLIRIIAMLKEIQVRVIMVVLPHAECFARKNQFIIEKNRKLFYKRMKRIESEIGYFEIRDYCNDDYDMFPDSCFHDSLHLNYCGAVKMTQVLKKDIFQAEAKKAVSELRYSVFVPGFGWLPYEDNGAICGISGLHRGIQGIRIECSHADVLLNYQICSLNTGWTESEPYETGIRVPDNMSVNAIRIYGSMQDNTILRYRVYIFGDGWTQWVIKGEIAGYVDHECIIEAIQIEMLGFNKTT